MLDIFDEPLPFVYLLMVDLDLDLDLDLTIRYNILLQELVLSNRIFLISLLESILLQVFLPGHFHHI